MQADQITSSKLAEAIPGLYDIETCETAPNADEMTALLREYYDLMTQRVESMGGLTEGTGATALEEFWNEIDHYLPPMGRLLVVRNAAGAMVGTGSLKQIGGGKGEMKRLYVRPEARGNGLGRMLVEKRISEARFMGLHELLVDTFGANVEMRVLYSKLGFEEIDFYPESATFRMAPRLRPYMVFFRMRLT